MLNANTKVKTKRYDNFSEIQSETLARKLRTLMTVIKKTLKALQYSSYS